MYAVYKQAHPPTGLEFSMYCNFFNNSERNLVVAGTSQLYVYRLNRDSEVGRPAGAAAPRGEGCPGPRRSGPTAPRLVVSSNQFPQPPHSLLGSAAYPGRLICSFVFSTNHVNMYCVLGFSDTVENKTCTNSEQEDTY